MGVNGPGVDNICRLIPEQEVEMIRRKNVVLIGMPGCGKSTIGVVLAKVVGARFIDADLLIQESQGMLLRDIIARYGDDGFLKIENDVNKSIETENAVIATGGSAVYCTEAMEKYRENDIVVYIRLEYQELEKRLGNLKRRGVVLKDGQTLKDLYNERTPLYEKYAHIIVDSDNMSVEELMDAICSELHKIGTII